MNKIPINTYDLSTTCRLCLSSGITVSDIFAFSTKMGNQVADVIMNCASIQITKHDEMPNFICDLCYIQLEKSHQFRVQIIQSDKTLRRYLHRLHGNKPQIETECFSQESSENPLTHNINADIVNEGESLETPEAFHINMNRKENAPQNFHSVTKNEIYFKLEVKDEPMSMNVSFPTDYSEETLSKSDDCEIVCEDSEINIANSIMDESGYCTNLKNDELADRIDDNVPFKFEIKDEPMDDNSLFQYFEYTEETSLKCDDSEISNEDQTENVDKLEEGKHNLTLKQKKINPRKLYQCIQCDKSFENTYGLRIHKRVHTIGKEYKCEVCDICFPGLRSLNFHKRTHTVEKPYQCDVCNKRFNRSQNLKIHKRTHIEEKPYKCDVCNNCFFYARSFKSHKRTHTGGKLYKCDVCNICFKQSNHLNLHKRTHTGEKPHKCDVCNKSFNRSSNLYIHKRTHTGENPP